MRIKVILADFATESTRSFFTKLSIESSLFGIDPSECHSINYYKNTHKMTQEIKVTNYNAKRAIALIQTYNNHFTKNEKPIAISSAPEKISLENKG